MYDAIIVPLQGSPHCEQAVHIACDEARQHQSIIVLVQVIPYPERPVPDPRIPCSGPQIPEPVFPHDRIGQVTAASQDYLERVRQRHALPQETIIRVVVGEPVKRILSEAERWPSSLIVMTTGEATNLAPPSLSEVTRRVLTQATVPVMAVHAPCATEAGVCARDFAMV